MISCGSNPEPMDPYDLPDINLENPQDLELLPDLPLTDPGQILFDPGLPPDLPPPPDQRRDLPPPIIDIRPDRITPPPGDMGPGDDVGEVCEIYDGCPFDDDGCLGTSAVLEVVALDIWAQQLKDPTVDLFTEEGTKVTLYGSVAKSTWLCGPLGFDLSVEAPQHESLALFLDYDGSGDVQGLSFNSPADKVGAWVTTELYDAGDGPTRYYTVWVGLPHLWFAPTGYPARHGNEVELLIDGEEAWHQTYTDMNLAEELVAITTWWWASDFELYRHPDLHTYQDTNERYWNTIVGILDYLDYLGVESKILVNQFWSQDGILSGITVDTQLLDRAADPNDLIEYMGMANQLWGTFNLEFDDVDFKARVEKAWALSPEYESLGAFGLPSFHPPHQVNMNDVPLGLDLLNLPHASWHQKAVIIDQEIALIGGMNLTGGDWDTVHHEVFDSRRMGFNATTEEKLDVQAKLLLPDFTPWKDYVIRVEGPSAIDAMRVFDLRWWYQIFIGAEFSDQATQIASLNPVPEPLEGGIQAQVVTTMPPPFYGHSLMETMLRAIAQAEDYILIEDQYFRSPILSDAIYYQMLQKPDLKLIVITNPVNQWTDPGCWQTYKEIALFVPFGVSRFGVFQLKSFDWADTGCLLCIDEVQGYFQPIFVHSKLVIIDDKYLQTGSANHNNRGLLYEGELAVAVYDEAWVRSARNRVLKYMLGSLYAPDMPWSGILMAFDNLAWWNDLIYEEWGMEGFDLNLNGASPPTYMLPDGKVYYLPYDDPSYCLFENVGPDIM